MKKQKNQNNKNEKNKKIKVVLPFRISMHFHKMYDGGAKYLEYFSEELVKQGVDVVVVTSLLPEMTSKNDENLGVQEKKHKDDSR